MRHTGLMRLAALGALIVCAASLPATAQFSLPIVVVTPSPPDPAYPDVPDAQQFDNIQQAVAAATALAANQGRLVSVLVTEGTWPTSSAITLGADDNIEIIGVGVTTPPDDGPSKVIIQGSGVDDVFELTDTPSTVLLEGLTIQGGVNGVNLLTALGTNEAVIHRCHIRNNTNHGIRCAGASTPLIVNCIIRDNTQDGVRSINTSDPDIVY